MKYQYIHTDGDKSHTYNVEQKNPDTIEDRMNSYIHIKLKSWLNFSIMLDVKIMANLVESMKWEGAQGASRMQ